MECKISLNKSLEVGKYYNIELSEGNDKYFINYQTTELKDLEDEMLINIGSIFETTFNRLLMEFGLRNSSDRMDALIKDGYESYKRNNKEYIKKQITIKCKQIGKIEDAINKDKVDLDFFQELKEKMREDLKDLITLDRKINSQG